MENVGQLKQLSASTLFAEQGNSGKKRSPKKKKKAKNKRHQKSVQNILQDKASGK